MAEVNWLLILMKKSFTLALVWIVGGLCGYIVAQVPFRSSGDAKMPWQTSVTSGPEQDYRRHFSRVNTANPPDQAAVGPASSGPFGSSPEEFEYHMELWNRKQKGECILEMESPVSRKAQEVSAGKLVSLQAERRSSRGLQEALSRFGLSSEQIDLFRDHLSKITTASVLAEGYILQLQQTRAEFQDRVNDYLSPEAAKEYLSMEEGLRAQYDVDGFSSYMKSRNIEVGDDSVARVAKLIQETRTATYELSQGPFDGIPSPAFGDRQIVEKYERDVARMRIAREVALRAASERGFPEELIQRLGEYYSERIRSTEEMQKQFADRLDPAVKAKQTEELLARLRNGEPGK